MRGKKRPFGVAPKDVPRAAGPLKIAVPIDRAASRRCTAMKSICADVDAELERTGGDAHLQRAVLQALLGGQAARARQAPVVRGDVVLADALAEGVGDALGQPARVDEDERLAVRGDELDDAIVELGPLLVACTPRRARPSGRAPRGRGRGGGPRRRSRAARATRRRGARRDLVDRANRRREADALRPRAARAHDEILEALDGQREVRAALVASERVDLVEDDRVDALEPAPPRLGAEQHEERLRRGDEHVRRLLDGGAPILRRGVPGAHRHADRRDFLAPRSGERGDLGGGPLEVLLHVVRARRERRHVDDARALGRRGPTPRWRTSRSRQKRNAASVLPRPAAPRRGRPCRARSQATPPPAQASADRTAARTSPRPPGGTWADPTAVSAAMIGEPRSRDPDTNPSMPVVERVRGGRLPRGFGRGGRRLPAGRERTAGGAGTVAGPACARGAARPLAARWLPSARR